MKSAEKAKQKLYKILKYFFKSWTDFTHLIFEISSFTWFFSISKYQDEKIKKWIWFRNWFLQATQAVKVKFELDRKNQVGFKLNFFRVCKKLPNWHFKNQAQIDTALVTFNFGQLFVSIELISARKTIRFIFRCLQLFLLMSSQSLQTNEIMFCLVQGSK